MVNNQRPITVATVTIFASIESRFDNPALAIVSFHALYHSKEERELVVVRTVQCMSGKKKILIKPCLFWSMSLWILTSSFIAFSSTKNHCNNWKDVDHGRRECKPELLS